MSIDSFPDLFLDQLRDLLSSERQQVRALPRLIAAIDYGTLSAALKSHLDETRHQVSRMERIFEQLGLPPRGPRCRGMEGLIDEAAETLRQGGESALVAAAVVADLRRVKQYEVSAYATAGSYAKLLGRESMARLMAESAREDARFEEVLSRLADEEIHPTAMQVGLTEAGLP